MIATNTKRTIDLVELEQLVDMIAPPTENPNDYVLVDDKKIATMLSCSVRTIRRMVERREIPAPFLVRKMNRWKLSVIQAWIDDDCPKVDAAAIALRSKRS